MFNDLMEAVSITELARVPLTEFELFEFKRIMVSAKIKASIARRQATELANAVNALAITNTVALLSLGSLRDIEKSQYCLWCDMDDLQSHP